MICGISSIYRVWRNLREDWSCSGTDKEYKKEERYLIEWFEDLKLTYNWEFLRHDKKHPKGTYYIELEKQYF